MIASLVSLGLGALTLSPAFDPDILDYTASTRNNGNTITAAGAGGSAVTITVNDEPHANGTAANWEPGKNVVKITAGHGPHCRVYRVVVTKRED